MVPGNYPPPHTRHTAFLTNEKSVTPLRLGLLRSGHSACMLCTPRAKAWAKLHAKKLHRGNAKSGDPCTARAVS